MKILNISYFTPIKLVQKNNERNNNYGYASENYVTKPTKSFAYQDFNISFTGRTPEDFYAQDFNRNNMPQTMKDYLYDNYEFNQHIPPEQMMKEVFKYIEIADNFADVKSIYPNEDLFKNLHENNVNSRKGILSEIKVARELGDSPLLKDGEDDFGMYLLRKIYNEGKTLKEINKDFLEHDLNDEYKGVITEPIKYSTLSAYGIDYPNNAFWHSFINTRDEYKKFFITLPKNSKIPGVNAEGCKTGASSVRKSGTDVSDEVKQHKRRYNLKPHRRREIQKDIIEKKGADVETIKKTVVKRFGKDDPEASFIVKYMSPIMTVAADRAHMSEELKAFAEFERVKGRVGDQKTMLARFWKQNPKMLEVFSAAVTDTIDMFEDIYGEGGIIAINSDLEKITINSEKQKIIDSVNPDFLELLNYTQTIEPKRTERYEMHDKMQQLWDEHFLNRYGDPNEINVDGTSSIEEPSEELSWEEQLEAEAAKNNAKVYKVQHNNGQIIYITSNLDEVLNDEIKYNTRYLPTLYAAKYIKATKAEEFSDRFKFTLAVNKAYQKLNMTSGDEYEYDPEIFDNSLILPTKEYHDEFYKLVKFHADNYKLERAARMAIIDTMISGSDINVKEAKMYDMPVYNLNEGMVDGGEEAIREFKTVMRNSKKQIDRRYVEYTTSPNNSEINKIELAMMDMLSKYDSKKSILEDRTTIELITMLKEILPYDSNKEVFRLFMSYIVKENPYSKSLLQKGVSEEVKQAKFEIIMDDMLHILVASMQKMPNIVTMFNNEVYMRHKSNLVSDIQDIFDRSIKNLNFDGMTTFYNPQAINSYQKSIMKFRPNNEE